MYKKLGIIGGMGPAATYFFYKKIIENTNAKKDQEHIDMVILNHASMPDRTNAILTGKKKEFLELMKQDLLALESMGCENVAIPCNTSHYFIDEIQSFTSIPIINMVSETVSLVLKKFPKTKKIGIMATDGTISSGTYHKECERSGVLAVSPHPEAQASVMSLIYDDIKRGKPGNKSKFYHAYKDLSDSGCDAVILACTEISVFKEANSLPSNCIDAMDALVEQSILRSGASLKH